MAQYSSMKLLGARNMNCVVEIMEWSSKMDLMAFATEKGDIIIQRLNFQRILTFPCPGEDVKVRSLSWQPDGALLAAAFSNGTVALLDIEAEQQISQIQFEEELRKVFFSKPINVEDYRPPLPHAKQTDHTYYMPPLPTLNGESRKKTESRKTDKGAPCFLVSILCPGKVVLTLLGSLKAGCIELLKHVSNPDEFDVYDVRLSGDFTSVYALVKDDEELKLLHFKNEILQEYISPMLHLALECVNILDCKNYMNETIQLMMEAWESVLLEMENKLTKYANSQTEGALPADLLELLVFGFASAEIEEFIREELTEKSIKKLASTVELSYTNIQNLATQSLATATDNMFFFIDSINGLSQLLYYYQPLLDHDAAIYALRCCGSFMLKIDELLEVIEQSLYDMKLFFSWLCAVTMRLRHQDVPEESRTLQETTYLAEFLNCFEDKIIQNKDGTTTKKKFNLEKVGQYFEDQNLQDTFQDDPKDEFKTLLENNKCFRKSKLTFPRNKKLSLFQQRNKLFNALDDLVEKTNRSVSVNFILDKYFICSSMPLSTDELSLEDISKMIKSSFIVNESKKTDLFLITINYEEMLLMEFDETCSVMRCSHVDLRPTPCTQLNPDVNFQHLRFLDLQFYNEHFASLLLQAPENLQHAQQCYYVQCSIENTQYISSIFDLPLRDILSSTVQSRTIFDICDPNSFKPVEGVCQCISTSGPRKVASVLADNRKKMTIFEMEIEEEEDEDETDASHVSMLEISKDSNIS